MTTGGKGRLVLRRRIWLIAVLGLVLTGAGCGEEPRPQKRRSLYWQQRAGHFRALPDTAGEIIFLGDSITDGGNWGEMFASPRVKNRGISGDTTDGVLDRLDEVLGSKPAQIFLMIGINDLGRGDGEKHVLANIKSILREIRQKSPETGVFIQSILPVNDRFSVFPDYMDETPRILAVNTVLKRMAADYGMTFIDLFSAFRDESDRLAEKYTNDGLHLTGEGYAHWREVLKPFIDLGSR
jgi:lysophospholipase L1-like esterase